MGQPSWRLRPPAKRRDFAGRPAFDLEGFVLASGDYRSDRRDTFKLVAEKSLFPGSAPTREIGLRIEWLVGEVDSNDPYYDAGYQVFSTGVQVDF